jgi:asparagine synthase (glutamine-hydrolysing)
MCGIAGYLDLSRQASAADLSAIIHTMKESLAHRGPDDSGVWIDEKTGLAFGHRRLSILDLSPLGKQPMVSHCRRYVINYNGEVYNFASLRKELRQLGHSFSSQSDTEVVLAAIAQWGFEKALAKFVGMFGLAVFDTKEEILYLARDRIGEKPLYYGLQRGKFFFASELKALDYIQGVDPQIDPESLALLLQYGYIPAPRSIYQDFHKLLPGCYLKIDLHRLRQGHSPEIISYWSLDEIACRGQKNLFTGNETEAIDLLESHLKSIIKDQMMADVPVGAFFSGGIDSSLIVGIMQRLNSNPIKTFSIGFNEKKYNENGFAKKIAKYIGTDHTEFVIGPRDALALVEKLPSIYCEPFADSSQIPTFIVSALAKKRVTVVLTGDGGDEIFGGYPWYNFIANNYKFNKILPYYLKKLIHEFFVCTEDKYVNKNYRFLPGNFLEKEHIKEFLNFLQILCSNNINASHCYLMSRWKKNQILPLIGHDYRDSFEDFNKRGPFLGDKHQMMCNDMQSYLPDDILAKIDRAAMSVSLETRVPFLDHRLIEFIWQLPIGFKSRSGSPKWILRKTLSRYLPTELFDRPKHGFSIPLDQWLRGGLREWAEDTLNEGHLKRQGYFDPKIVAKTWQEHLSRTANWKTQLWNILMFQVWLDSKRK